MAVPPEISRVSFSPPNSALTCDCQILFKRQVTNPKSQPCQRPRSNPALSISRFNLNVVGQEKNVRSWTPEGKAYDCQLIIKSPQNRKGSVGPMWPILQDKAYSHFFLNQNCGPNPDNINRLINIDELKKRCLEINNKILSDHLWYVNQPCDFPIKKNCNHGIKIGPCKINTTGIRDIKHELSDICKSVGREYRLVNKSQKGRRPNTELTVHNIKINYDSKNNNNLKRPIKGNTKSDIKKNAEVEKEHNEEKHKTEKKSHKAHDKEPDEEVKTTKKKGHHDFKPAKKFSLDSIASKKDAKRKSINSRASMENSVSFNKTRTSKNDHSPVRTDKNTVVYNHSTDRNDKYFQRQCHEEQLKLISFETEPSFLDMHCFKRRSHPERYFYPDGSPAVFFEPDGSGRVFYSEGQLAIALTSTKFGYRMTIMSDPCFNANGEYECSVPVAVFDSNGNGVVYDIKGNKRMNFDQAEGILYDTRSGAPMRWQWKQYKWVVQRRKELQVLQETAHDSLSEKEFNASPSPSVASGKKSSENSQEGPAIISHSANFGSGIHSVATIKQHNSIGRNTEVSKYKSRKKILAPKELSPHAGSQHARESHPREPSNLQLPSSIPPTDTAPIEPRPIAMKISKAISLHILHQEHIHIDFRSFPIHLHLNIGVRLKMDRVTSVDKVTSCTPGLKPVPCFVDLFFRRTQSLKNIHDEIKLLQELTLEGRKQRNQKKAKIMGLSEKYIPSRESLASYIEYVK